MLRDFAVSFKELFLRTLWSFSIESSWCYWDAMLGKCFSYFANLRLHCKAPPLHVREVLDPAMENSVFQEIRPERRSGSSLQPCGPDWRLTTRVWAQHKVVTGIWGWQGAGLSSPACGSQKLWLLFSWGWTWWVVDSFLLNRGKALKETD